MNKRLINIFSVLIIVIGLIYLSKPDKAEAMFFPCCYFTPQECSNCVLICGEGECREACVDGGTYHGVARGSLPNPPPPDYPSSCQ